MFKIVESKTSWIKGNKICPLKTTQSSAVFTIEGVINKFGCGTGDWFWHWKAEQISFGVLTKTSAAIVHASIIW
jgi:hypothetical protein